MLDAIAKPFGMLLMFLYNLVGDYCVAIFLFAVIVKVILLPFQMKSKRGMIRQTRLQPKIAEIQKKHGTNKAKVNEETMKLYKEEGISPASGCLWGLLPFPIMLALYSAIRQPITLVMGVAAEQYALITEKLASLADFTAAEGFYVQIDQAKYITNNFSLFEGLSAQLQRLDFTSMGIDFSLTPQWDYLWNAAPGVHASWLAGFVVFLIPLLSGGFQILATIINKKMNPAPAAQEGQAQSMNTMMMLMPLMSVWIGYVTPAALGFYWTVGTILQIIQDFWLTKVYTKKIEAEEAVKNEERKKKEAEIEAKRLETERKRAEGAAIERNPNTSKRKKQISEKQEQLEKSAEWEKKNAPAEVEPEVDPSREGSRRFARGRAYDPNRYADAGNEAESGESDSGAGDSDEPDGIAAITDGGNTGDSSDDSADGDWDGYLMNADGEWADDGESEAGDKDNTDESGKDSEEG